MRKRARTRRGDDGVLSVRLDGERRRAIARVAKARKVTPSEVVRSAVDALIERASVSVRPYDIWKRVLGTADGLPPDLSENAGKKFAELLKRRRRA